MTTIPTARADIETLIERDLDRASRYMSAANANRWVLAMLASRIVGRRIEGLTLEFARRLGLTAPDAVEHWAKAWRMYRILRWYLGRRSANIARRELTVSHFYIMFDLGHKHKMSIEEIDGYFDWMITNKAREESWSVAALRAEVDADYPSGKAVDPKYHFNRAMKELEIGITFPETHQAIRRCVNLLGRLLRRF